MRVALVTLTRCDLMVNLDRGDVDRAVEGGCAICTNITEGGEDSGEDAGEEAGSVGGVRLNN
jgi:hypothetical protein